jgi:hypothetical protein
MGGNKFTRIFYDFEDSADNLDYLYTEHSFRCHKVKYHKQNLYYLYILQSLICYDVKDSGVNQYYTLAPFNTLSYHSNSWRILVTQTVRFLAVVVFLGFRDKPRMHYSLAGLLYRPIWTFQVRTPDASAPADVSRTPCLHACRRVPHYSSGSWNFVGGEMKPNFA